PPTTLVSVVPLFCHRKPTTTIDRLPPVTENELVVIVVEAPLSAAATLAPGVMLARAGRAPAQISNAERPKTTGHEPPLSFRFIMSNSLVSSGLDRPAGVQRRASTASAVAQWGDSSSLGRTVGGTTP